MLAYDDFAMTNDPVTGIPGRPPLGAELRRRKLLWVTAAVVGLALGIGVYKEMPPPYKATTLVQIRVIPGVLPTDEILTELALAQSRTVATTAMTMLKLPQDAKSVQSFMGRDAVTSPSDQFLQFTVKASSANDAVARAKALAQAFLRVRDNGLTSALANTVSALDKTIAKEKTQSAQLTAKIAAVQAQPVSTHQQAQLVSLQAQLSQLHGRLTGLEKAVQSYAVHSTLSNKDVRYGSKVLDRAKATPRSRIKYPVIYAAGGLFAGLAIGMGWVIVSALISTRPRRRYDIARALGAPVRLSVGRIRVSKLAARRAPESAGGRGIQQIATYLRSAIGREQGRASLAVVAADDPIVPALSIVSTALACVRDGRRVIVADLTPRGDAGRLLGCTEPGVHRQVAGQRNLTVAIPESSIAPPAGPIRHGAAAGLPVNADPELDHAYHAADLLLTLISIDPGLGADHLCTWATDAVVISTAGVPSATKLRTISELIRLSGTAVMSGVLVGADKVDESFGAMTFADDDDLAEPAEEPGRRDVREANVAAQPNGSAERSQARREPQERPRVGAERRAEARPEVTSPEVKAAGKAETTRPDARYEPLRTQRQRTVDLHKEDGKRHPDVPAKPETATQPENARSDSAPGPLTRPYADAGENVVEGEPSRSSAWRG
jgi:capsular polysaccharide biosynthesis protein